MPAAPPAAEPAPAPATDGARTVNEVLARSHVQDVIAELDRQKPLVPARQLGQAVVGDPHEFGARDAAAFVRRLQERALAHWAAAPPKMRRER